jgi:hypothetical protein
VADERVSPENQASVDEPLEAFYGDEAEEAQRLAASPPDGSGGLGDSGSRSGSGSSPAGGSRWRAPVTGAVMAGIAMGLRDVFEPEYHDRTAVEQPAPTQPLEPQKYEVHLDPVAPESSFAIYRPWVDDEPDESRPASGGRDGEAAGGGAGALGG